MKNEKTITLIDRLLVIGLSHEEIISQTNPPKHISHNAKILEEYKSSNLKEAHNENYIDNITSVFFFKPVLFSFWYNILRLKRSSN
jgi:hypothetical protein